MSSIQLVMLQYSIEYVYFLYSYCDLHMKFLHILHVFILVFQSRTLKIKICSTELAILFDNEHLILLTLEAAEFCAKCGGN